MRILRTSAVRPSHLVPLNGDATSYSRLSPAGGLQEELKAILPYLGKPLCPWNGYHLHPNWPWPKSRRVAANSHLLQIRVSFFRLKKIKSIAKF